VEVAKRLDLRIGYRTIAEYDDAIRAGRSFAALIV
jgi:hypothetical protein